MILENLTPEFHIYDCTIKITERGVRFEATVVSLTQVLVEQAAALETGTKPVSRLARKLKHAPLLQTKKHNIQLTVYRPCQVLDYAMGNPILS